MPATSRNQRIAAAIALHHPDKLNAANRGMLRMDKGDLHDFAVTKTAGLAKKKRAKHPMRAMLGMKDRDGDYD